MPQSISLHFYSVLFDPFNEYFKIFLSVGKMIKRAICVIALFYVYQ